MYDDGGVAKVSWFAVQLASARTKFFDSEFGIWYEKIIDGVTCEGSNCVRRDAMVDEFSGCVTSACVHYKAG